MRVTLLGSGDAVGVPAPMCDCEYCLDSERRRRPALLVEAAETAVVLDLGPDIADQLHEAGVYDVDAFFATHAHYDHYFGIHELTHAAMDAHVENEGAFDHPTFGKEITVRGSRGVRTFTEDAFPHVLDHVTFDPIEPDETASVGPLSVTAFPLNRGDASFPTQGYCVEHDDAAVAYAPDVARMPEVPGPCSGVDLLFFDGSILGAEYHGDAGLLRADLDRIDADRVALTNVSEHVLERHTGDLPDLTEHEVWADFETATL